MSDNELLIIGNGFDLSAGLKTTYKDFFENRYSSDLIDELKMHLKNKNVVPHDLINLPNVNFWDIFFLLKYLDVGNKDKNWSNIEEEIKFFLIEKMDRKFIFNDSLKKDTFKHVIGYSSSADRNDTIDYNFFAFKLIEVINGYAYSKIINNSPENFDAHLDEFLSSELLKFEDVFAKYIRIQVEGNFLYMEDSKLIVTNLVSDISKTSVLSFNYTDILNKGLIGVENVHGKSSQGIIFGIDYKDLDYNSEEYKYSKTYRKLLMNIQYNSHIDLPRHVSKIKFYGHSLSDADYSYFQSIFDFYSIYNSNVIIELFFYVFDETYRKKIVNDQMLAVTRLFSIYGKTMNNADHGKNLLHKLLLENRVRIIEINRIGNFV